MPPDERADVHPDEAEMVGPTGAAGMSVAPRLEDLPFFLVPVRLRSRVPGARGPNRIRVWKHGEGPFAAGPVAKGVNLAPTSAIHGVVEPMERMHIDDLQSALAETRPSWTDGEQ